MVSPEVQKLADQLKNQGIAKSHMDALRMAENMLQIDITKNKKSKITNITYNEDDIEPNTTSPTIQPEISVSETVQEITNAAHEQQINNNSEELFEQIVIDQGSYPETTENIAEEIESIELEEGDEESPAEIVSPAFQESTKDVREEIDAIESLKNTEIYEGDIENNSYEENDEAVGEEIESIEESPDEADETRVEEELEEPELYEKEQEYIAEESTEVTDEVTTIIHEKDSQEESHTTDSTDTQENTTQTETHTDNIADDDVVIEELDEDKRKDITNLF